MSYRYLPIKFGLDQCSGSEKSELTYGRTHDGCLRHDSNSADKVKQS